MTNPREIHLPNVPAVNDERRKRLAHWHTAWMLEECADRGDADILQLLRMARGRLNYATVNGGYTRQFEAMAHRFVTDAISALEADQPNTQSKEVSG